MRWQKDNWLTNSKIKIQLKAGGTQQQIGCKNNHERRKKKYFNGTHLLDLALNDEKSDQISLFGMSFKSN